jgi:hypothetical protein
MPLTKLLVRQKLIFACGRITSSITRKKKGKSQVATQFLHNLIKMKRGNHNERIMENGKSKHFMYFWKGWNMQETMLNLYKCKKKKRQMVLLQHLGNLKCLFA